VQPRPGPRLLRSTPWRGALALLWLAALDPGPASGGTPPTPIGDPTLAYRFITDFADGDQEVEGPVYQVGGKIEQGREVEEFPDGLPEMTVVIQPGALPFWVDAAAPSTFPNPSGKDPIATDAYLEIWQGFRKDTENARLFFNLTGARFTGLDPSPPTDQKRPEALLSLAVSVLQPGILLWSYSALAVLKGLGGAWDTDNGGNFDELPFEVTGGALDQSYVELSLTGPFRHEVDLSSVAKNHEFTLLYILRAHAKDTAQVDTGINVWGRDPLEPVSGTFFEYEGLTPTDDPDVVPEPGGAVLLFAGLSVLLAAHLSGARARRRR
jgi:hypothetical protein